MISHTPTTDDDRAQLWYAIACELGELANIESYMTAVANRASDPAHRALATRWLALHAPGASDADA